MTTNSKWRDVTSYSRDDMERTPRSWSLDFGDGHRLVVTRMHGIADTWFGHRLVVTRMHGIADTWFVQCPTVDSLELKARDEEGAKREAVEIFTQMLKRWLQALEETAL